MTPQDALILITEIKKMCPNTQKSRLGPRAWDFVNAMHKLLTIYPAWKKITKYQSDRLEQIYRDASGHQLKLYSRIEGAK